MKNRIFYLVLIAISIFLSTGCEFGLDPGNTTITGQIVDSQTGDPVQSVTVKILDGELEITEKTDIELIAKSSATSAVSGGFELILEKIDQS